MKTRLAITGSVNLDVLALALLTCLLSSVLGMLVLGGGTAAKNGEIERDWNALQNQTARLRPQIDALEQSRKTIWDQVNYALLQGENERLDVRVSKLENDVDSQAKDKQRLLKEIADATADVSRLERKVARKSGRSEELKRLLGDFTGSFVLLECTSKGAIVYPGRAKFPLNPSEEDLKTLTGLLVDKGCLVMAVRPSAWSNQAFEKLRTTIYRALESVKPDLLRATFPITDHESLAVYLPDSANIGNETE